MAERANMSGGFNEEDRRRFERMDFRVEDILRRLDDIVARLRTVETSITTTVSREELRDLEVDIDELRGGKADKSELGVKVINDHEARLRILENVLTDIKGAALEIRKDVEPLKAWRWKQLGAIGVIVGLLEFVGHAIFK